MKKCARRIFTLIITLLMVTSYFIPVANAVQLVDEDEVESVKVYKEDKRVRNVDVYIDGDGVVWVASMADLCNIFPEETKPLSFANSIEATPLMHWCDVFGYFMSCKDNKVYITQYDEDIKIPELDDSRDPDFPYLVPEDEDVSIYVNGVKINNVDAYLDSNNNVRLSSKFSLRTIFPNETKNVYLSYESGVLLETWAKQYNYVFIRKGSDVYLNNNGLAPVEISLNGKIVDFPDQQPIIVPPGRTMIPVAMLAQELGFTVEWKSREGNNKYDRVLINNSDHHMVLWIGYGSYWLDGSYHPMDVKPYVINGRTMVPLAFIAEAFGLDITYDGTRSVKVVGLFG